MARKIKSKWGLSSGNRTIPLDVVVLVLIGTLIFIIFTAMYRGCATGSQEKESHLEYLP